MRMAWNTSVSKPDLINGMRMTALSVTSHVLLMTNIPADQPLGGDWTGVVFWSKLNTRRIVSSALNMGLYVAEVPWAYPGSRFTKDFDLTVAWFASYLPRSTTSYFMRVDWETVGRCVNRALHDLEPERSRRLDGLVNIGIDETSYKKDHRVCKWIHSWLRPLCWFLSRSRVGYDSSRWSQKRYLAWCLQRI